MTSSFQAALAVAPFSLWGSCPFTAGRGVCVSLFSFTGIFYYSVRLWWTLSNLGFLPTRLLYSYLEHSHALLHVNGHRIRWGGHSLLCGPHFTDEQLTQRARPLALRGGVHLCYQLQEGDLVCLSPQGFQPAWSSLQRSCTEYKGKLETCFRMLR